MLKSWESFENFATNEAEGHNYSKVGITGNVPPNDTSFVVLGCEKYSYVSKTEPNGLRIWIHHKKEKSDSIDSKGQKAHFMYSFFVSLHSCVAKSICPISKL